MSQIPITGAEALQRARETRELEIHTCMPGTVRSFDLETQTADIELGTRQVLPGVDDDSEDTTQDYPILPSVPIEYPGGGGFRLSWPLEVGDTGLVVFSESDLNAWRADGGVVDPGVSTRFGLSGGVFRPGLHTRSGANPKATSGTFRIDIVPRGTVPRGTGIVLTPPFLEITGTEIRLGGLVALVEASPLSAILNAIIADLAAIASGYVPASSAYTPTANAALLVANPIETTTTKGT